MKTNNAHHALLLLLTAFIWGVAFVAQSAGGDAVGPYTFNSIRSLIGGAVLIPVIFFLQKTGLAPKHEGGDRATLIKGGIACGIALGLASMTQQLGMYYGAGTGKAGFLTACYILLVPILGIFLGKKCGKKVWIGVALALVGLYLICINGAFRLGRDDILLLVSALLFSVHILIIDHFSPMVDGVKMSCIQFWVAGLLCVAPMLCVDMGFSAESAAAWRANLASGEAWISILYAGVLSSGVAYTLQIVGQRGMNPTVAALIMSMESVFSLLAGWVLLDQTMSIKELLGCVLVFAAIILAQLPDKTAEAR
ncbi:MAG: DMT family transporter [Oscillospiraceae bacterium]|nr:DMT family transporter [Oscillospiraceae bacterium]MCD8191348.1 DMT family transporter [Oscillospiraceae bacterium]MCD8343073.1 DMT family transporter [Oscillospiraceae bacterium]